MASCTRLSSSGIDRACVLAPAQIRHLGDVGAGFVSFNQDSVRLLAHAAHLLLVYLALAKPSTTVSGKRNPRAA